ncbi:MAG: hypothetical protein WCK32_03675 [Chlorobiaceae bacterium]
MMDKKKITKDAIEASVNHISDEGNMRQLFDSLVKNVGKWILDDGDIQVNGNHITSLISEAFRLGFGAGFFDASVNNAAEIDRLKLSAELYGKYMSENPNDPITFDQALTDIQNSISEINREDD